MSPMQERPDYEARSVNWPEPIDAPPHEPVRAWVGDQGTVVRTSQLTLADYPTERFGVSCGVCLRSLPDCAARQEAARGN